MLNIQKSIKNYKYFLRESGPVQNNIEDTQRSQEVKEVKSEVGLSSYEQDHNSKQSAALIERVRNLRNLKSDPNAAFSNLQQMQLTVAENLLGEKALAAEFDTKIPTKTREQRIANAANRVTGWNKFDSSNSIQAQIEAITNGGSDTGEKKIIVNGNQNKFDKLTYDKNEDLTSFSFERNRTIADNQESLQAWTEALPRYQKVSKEFQDKITQLEDQKNSIKDGINFFAKKGNQEKRNVLNREINSLITSLQSSNENINKANLRINSLTAENSKLTQEITNYKVELDREYVL